MAETSFFIARAHRQLFAVLHEPEPSASGASFVFCHPIAEEKLWSHRVFVATARGLAAAGHRVLRLDLLGNGDSDGDFAEMSVESAIDDINSGIGYLASEHGVSTVSLLGLRFGATIAALVAERRDDIDSLVLWAPIVDGARYMQELLRVNVATQTTVFKEVRHDRSQLVDMMRGGGLVNVDGYEMSYGLFGEASAIRLDEKAKRHSQPTLVVQIDRPGATPSEELQRLASSYPRGTAIRADEEPFWREIPQSYLCGAPRLFAATTEWLGAVKGDRSSIA